MIDYSNPLVNNVPVISTGRKRVATDEYLMSVSKWISNKRSHHVILQVIDKGYYELKSYENMAWNFELVDKMEPEEEMKITKQLEECFGPRQSADELDISSLPGLKNLTCAELMDAMAQKTASDGAFAVEDKDWWNAQLDNAREFLSQVLEQIKQTASEKGWTKSLRDALDVFNEERRLLASAGRTKATPKLEPPLLNAFEPIHPDKPEVGGPSMGEGEENLEGEYPTLAQPVALDEEPLKAEDTGSRLPEQGAPMLEKTNATCDRQKKREKRLDMSLPHGPECSHCRKPRSDRYGRRCKKKLVNSAVQTDVVHQVVIPED